MRTTRQTLAQICGPKWPRLLPLTWAAAYCGMDLVQFRADPQLSALIVNFAGKERVDKTALDTYIDTISGNTAK